MLLHYEVTIIEWVSEQIAQRWQGRVPQLWDLIANIHVVSD